MRKLILNKKENKLISMFLEYYINELEHTKYELSEDFIGTSVQDMSKYHVGMRFIVSQMHHELRGFQTRKEYNESIKNNNNLI